MYNLPGKASGDEIISLDTSSLPEPLRRAVFNCLRRGFAVCEQYSEIDLRGGHRGAISIRLDRDEDQINYNCFEYPDGHLEEMAREVRECFEREGIDTELRRNGNGGIDITDERFIDE